MQGLDHIFVLGAGDSLFFQNNFLYYKQFNFIRMENLKNDILITEFQTTKEGVVLHLNKKTSLINGNIKNDEFFVSWDKIGGLLFKNYCDSSDISILKELRNNK